MFRAFAYTLLILLITSADSKKIGPRHVASRGYVWPKASQEKKVNETFNVNPEDLKFEVTGYDCPKIQLAIQRFKDSIDALENTTKLFAKELVPQKNYSYWNKLKINLSQKCEDFPQLGMDEGYSLRVSKKSELNSSSVWGILRGIETFSQLFYIDRTNDSVNIQIQGTNIVDWPNYPHRGIMLDTSRHYLSVQNILKTLDAMAMNKMNVFHWHIIDDESFPYQSTRLPEFIMSAFHPSLVYTRTDMEAVRNYAADLGIRVLVEFNVPGHNYCWSVVHPETFVQCQDDGEHSCPLNPIRKETFDLLKELLQEAQSLFPDKFFHVGGNDVKTEYYLQDQAVVTYMTEHGVTNTNDIYALFFKKLFPLLKNDSSPVVWADVFEAGVSLPDHTLVQVKDGGDGSDAMVRVLEAGHRGIQSAPFNLGTTGSSRGYETSWFYKFDPRHSVRRKLSDDALLKNLVGGTACVWGEMVDDSNVMSMVWPRASGVAEVLWSETSGEGPDEATLRRLEEQLCRMTRRGVPAGPSTGPGSCYSAINYSSYNRSPPAATFNLGIGLLIIFFSFLHNCS